MTHRDKKTLACHIPQDPNSLDQTPSDVTLGVSRTPTQRVQGPRKECGPLVVHSPPSGPGLPLGDPSAPPTFLLPSSARWAISRAKTPRPIPYLTYKVQGHIL